MIMDKLLTLFVDETFGADLTSDDIIDLEAGGSSMKYLTYTVGIKEAPSGSGNATFALETADDTAFTGAQTIAQEVIPSTGIKSGITISIPVGLDIKRYVRGKVTAAGMSGGKFSAGITLGPDRNV